MTAPVDVLAVMDALPTAYEQVMRVNGAEYRAITKTHEFPNEWKWAIPLKGSFSLGILPLIPVSGTARAAVAELLEAAEYMIHEREAMGPLNPDWVVFRAALARCKGGAA